jgi:hypothetical protein
MGKPEGTRPLGIPKRWWNDVINLNLTAVEREDVDWVHLA